ncbi:hypothetical protein UJ101_01440 [Flavobacteriaceae bacterium UJ101]|nr:hypothetical protein UJ101_01440 [Flavobacteriaceae bacterium UJ101]
MFLLKKILNFDLTLRKQLINTILVMRNTAIFLLMMIPLSMMAYPLKKVCSDTIWIENVEELKELVLKKGDHQVFKHEYVPHYKIGDFHIYLKEGDIILYNRYDKERREYKIMNTCKDELENKAYSEAIQKVLKQN